MAWVLIKPPPGSSPGTLMTADPVHHPNNTPGAILVKQAGEELDPSCCCVGRCCEIPLSDVMCATFSIVDPPDSGNCDGLEGFVVPLTRVPQAYPTAEMNEEVWEGEETCGNMEWRIVLYCDLSEDPETLGPHSYKMDWYINGINSCAVTVTEEISVDIVGTPTCEPFYIPFVLGAGGNQIFDANGFCGCCENTAPTMTILIEMTECL